MRDTCCIIYLIEAAIHGFVLRPPVLGHAKIPVVVDRGDAARRPELAVLSAMAHGQSEQGAAIAAAVLPAIRDLDDERARFYGDLVLNSLNEAARRTLEAMATGRRSARSGSEASGQRSAPRNPLFLRL